MPLSLPERLPKIELLANPFPLSLPEALPTILLNENAVPFPLAERLPTTVFVKTPVPLLFREPAPITVFARQVPAVPLFVPLMGGPGLRLFRIEEQFAAFAGLENSTVAVNKSATALTVESNDFEEIPRVTNNMTHSPLTHHFPGTTHLTRC